MPEHFICLLFFECLGIQFFNSLTCDLRDTMPRQRAPTLLPREAENFPRGDRNFKHVPPLTFLIYLSPKELHVLRLFKRCDYLAMSLARFELFSRYFIVLRAQFFIRLATEFYDQWQIKELMFYSIEALILP